ncbi:MAG: alpha-1,3-galactosidase B [Muribaculaceae bacterium]|nr:alpha-1,3-galactosidase B [Muribaculaceae bacterium]
MKKFLTIIVATLPLAGFAKVREVRIAECSGAKLSAVIAKNLKKKQSSDTLRVTLTGKKYLFNPAEAIERELYISNHDQDNPKSVGLMLENAENLIIQGGGAEFIFDGRMLPIAAVNVSNLTIEGVSIDFTRPHISQIVIEENKDGRIIYRPEDWVDFEVRDSNFIAKGTGWELTPTSGIAFEEGTRHIVYRSSDIGVATRNVRQLADGRISAPWNNPSLKPGTRVAMRGWGRPTPGILLDRCKDVSLDNVKIHYAEGMGLLAQNTENITLSYFGVCLRGDSDPRYFTTQADATHFSSCWGKITSNDGLYEGMMDDAINVHGTYLRIVQVVDSMNVIARYMHPQTYGFDWGAKGDSVQIIAPRTMELTGANARVASIEQMNLKEFRITFDHPVEAAETYGIENLTRTPEVEFRRNTIRNNRARGALFSTPRRTICADNLFDHTSGSAILLCGDCNGWFETGACRDVTITGNRFVNALTSQFQFTNAVISIYPEIPDLKGQTKYFHSGIRITDNVFETFDNPLLYAKSVDGLIFLNNTIVKNTDYLPYHPQTVPVFLEKVTNASVQ